MKKKIIEQFIVKQWLRFFFLFFSILMLIITIAEFVTGLLDNQSFITILTAFTYKLPGFLSKILPVNCLLASLFMTSKQKGTNELTAILAGGFSRMKYVATVLKVALFIAVLQFLLVSFLEPKIFKYKYSKEISLRTLKKEGKFLARSFLGTGRTWYKNEDYFLSFGQYVAKDKTISDINLYYYTKGKLLRRIEAKSARYNDEHAHWILNNAIFFENLAGENVHSFIKRKTFPITLKEVPDDFKTFESDIKTFNIFTLYQFINKLKNTGIETSSYSILLYEKISLAFICLIFAFFPLVSINNPNKRSSSIGINIGLTLGFAIFYWLGHSTILNLGASQRIPPIAASFMMPFLIILALAFYWKKRA